MKKFALTLFVLGFAFSCIKEDFKKTCPYDLQLSSHTLRVPISFSPHQMQYKVGDTLEVSTVFSDSIYDLAVQRKFKIQNFPFKPVTLLYRYYDDAKWDAGYRVNHLRVDSVYHPYYNFSSQLADGFRAETIYKEGMYKFKYKLIFEKPGKYILLMTDMYMEHSATGDGDLNAEADAVTFEGKCPTLGYKIASMVEGDNHLDAFEPELRHLDTTVYFDKFTNIGIRSFESPYGEGSLGWEWNGTYCFEVVE